MRKLKKISIDMEDAIFQMCQNYAVLATWNRGMKLKLDTF